jgi:hypothetical protein
MSIDGHTVYGAPPEEISKRIKVVTKARSQAINTKRPSASLHLFFEAIYRFPVHPHTNEGAVCSNSGQVFLYSHGRASAIIEAISWLGARVHITSHHITHGCIPPSPPRALSASDDADENDL